MRCASKSKSEQWFTVYRVGGRDFTKQLGDDSGSLGEERDAQKFFQFEQAISEQMDVIDKLTDEKQKQTVDLNNAMQLIKQMERENATLAFQVKGLLEKLSPNGVPSSPTPPEGGSR